MRHAVLALELPRQLLVGWAEKAVLTELGRRRTFVTRQLPRRHPLIPPGFFVALSDVWTRIPMNLSAELESRVRFVIIAFALLLYYFASSFTVCPKGFS